MSQFTPRLPSTPQPEEKGAQAKLRLSPYPQEKNDSIYHQRHQETQQLQNLSFWENTDREASEEEDEWETRQSPAPFILVIIILVVASTLLWFLFQWASSENSNTPLIIAANTAPFKVRPENPGGMMIPHQDKLIYGRLSQNTPQPMERLLPPPEQPMMAPPHQPVGHGPLSQQQQQPYYPPQGHGQEHTQGHSQGQQGYVPPAQGYPAPPPPQQGMPQQPPFQQGQPQPYPSSQPQAPYAQPQHPLSHQPIYEPPKSPYGPAPVTMPPAVLPSPQPALDLTTPKISTVETIKPALDEDEGNDPIPSDGRHELDQLIAKEAATPLRRTIRKQDAPTKLKPLDPGKHKVQIASLPSRPMAEQEMKRLRMHYGSIFEDKAWNIQRVNLGPNRGVTHRLVVGSFPSYTAATKFCKIARLEKIGCLVVAPTSE